jgi:hypothetical protein
MSTEIPKHELLIKLMKMTTAGDGEALTAIRMANKILSEGGWDWERLLRGKITVIADPFSSPGPSINVQTKKASPPPQPKQAPPQRTTPAAPDPFAGMPQWSSKPKPQHSTTGTQFKTASGKPVAPAKPLHFRRDSTGTYRIASHIAIDHQRGMKLDISKLNGSCSQETLGRFIEQDPNGYYLYEIDKAGKWKNKYAGGSPNINSL